MAAEQSKQEALSDGEFYFKLAVGIVGALLFMAFGFFAFIFLI